MISETQINKMINKSLKKYFIFKKKFGRTLQGSWELY